MFHFDHRDDEAIAKILAVILWLVIIGVGVGVASLIMLLV